jgi:ribulose-phosphate 3-epimerase
MSNDNIKISGSILSANFLQLKNDILAIESAGIDSLHLDVMDNHMAPNVSFGPPIIKAVNTVTDLPLDTHLMIDAPWLFFDDYIAAGSTDICFHVECYDENIPNHDKIKQQSRVATSVDYDKIKQHVQYLQSKQIKAGITINPDTDASVIFPILDVVDYVLVMSVHPGFSGQSFIPDSLTKIRAIRERFDKNINVDGGVNASNAQSIIDAGANVLITASYLFGAQDYESAINALR